MRVYHFVNAKFGLEDLERRRLKVARINGLNDPFELESIVFSKVAKRDPVPDLKREMSDKFGMLCFSDRWTNPTHWSHYADSHKGLCLGFDIPNSSALTVRYVTDREILKDADFKNQESKLAMMQRLIRTKHVDWQYENEVRVFVDLSICDEREDGLYFSKFSDQLILKEVIVGVNYRSTRHLIDAALGDLLPQIEVFRAALSDNAFRIERH